MLTESGINFAPLALLRRGVAVVAVVEHLSARSSWGDMRTQVAGITQLFPTRASRLESSIFLRVMNRFRMEVTLQTRILRRLVRLGGST